MLQRPCPECGLAASGIEIDQLGPLIRRAVPRWEAALARPGAAVRPRPDRWSVSEYGAHVRDVFRIFGQRLALMLRESDPAFANWDQDATALEDGYASQDPVVISAELAVAARALADAFDAVRADQHGRTGRRSNGSTFTVLTLGQYFWHDVAHHLHDVAA